MKDLVQITGFKELEAKIKRLPDKVKKREIVKILGQVANPTLKAMRTLAPVGSGVITIKDKQYQRKRRQIGKTIIQSHYKAGLGKKTLAKKVMRKTPNAVVVVGPRTRKGKDGYFLRQWVIPGTKFQKANPFVDKAYQQTRGMVTADAEKKITKYIQKQIDRL